VNRIDKDPLQKRIELSNWIILAVLFFPSLFFGFKFALGVLLGGFISIINFFWMERGLQGVISKQTSNPKKPAMIKYFIRLAATAVVLYFLIAYKTVDTIGLILGLSVVVINIVVTMITLMAKKNFSEEVR